ncbi:hypothetical protein ON010_g18272 [Phytophthora cinnamomi]|nr:hypothetical protein ON010_g18272 [Phytophthora cinnamomi]
MLPTLSAFTADWRAIKHIVRARSLIMYSKPSSNLIDIHGDKFQQSWCRGGFHLGLSVVWTWCAVETATPWRTLKRVASTWVQHPGTISADAAAHIFNDAPADVFTPLISPDKVARLGDGASSTEPLETRSREVLDFLFDFDFSFWTSDPVDDAVADRRLVERGDATFLRGSTSRYHSSHTHSALAAKAIKNHADASPKRTSTRTEEKETTKLNSVDVTQQQQQLNILHTYRRVQSNQQHLVAAHENEQLQTPSSTHSPTTPIPVQLVYLLHHLSGLHLHLHLPHTLQPLLHLLRLLLCGRLQRGRHFRRRGGRRGRTDGPGRGHFGLPRPGRRPHGADDGPRWRSSTAGTRRWCRRRGGSPAGRPPPA